MSARRPTRAVKRTWTSRLVAPALVAAVAAGAATAQAAGGDPLEAPGWNWPFRHAVAGKQEVKAAAFDASGNAVVVGYTQPFGEDKDVWVAKVKADGSALAWAPKVYDRAGAEDVATAVTVDAAGNLYVAGHVWNGSNSDVYTAKYAADGTLAWQATWNYAARNGDDLATAIAVDSSGYVYVAGHSQAASGDDGLLLKYAPGGPDVNGAPAQAIRYDGGQGNDLFYAAAAGTGGVVVTGTSRNASGTLDVITVKYAAGTGALLWQKRKATTGDNTGWLVKMDTAGNAVVAASVVNASANRDIYVAKLAAADGAPAWERTHDSGLHDDPKALALDANGNVFVTGTVDTVGQALNVHTLKYAADGTPAWGAGATFNTTNGDQDVPKALAVDAAGDVYVAGYSYSAAGGNYNYLTLKHKHDTGQVLWSALYQGAAGKDDQALGLGLLADAVVVAGWSNSAGDGTEDYDLTVVAYDPGRINAPSAPSAVVETGPQVTLTWTDNADNEDGFCVQRRDTAHAFSDFDCTVPAHPGTGTVVYTDDTVAADAAYWYRVRARSAAFGDSGHTSEVYVRSTVVVWGAPAWVYQHAGDSGVDKATAIAVGSDAHPVVTGLSFFMVDELYGSIDFYTAKIDRASADAVGDELWGARYADEFDAGDEANSVAVDSQNRVIVTGYATLDSGQAENTNDLLTIFYPALGPPGELTDQYAGPGNDDDRSVAVAAAVDGSDNVAVVGYGKNAVMNDDIYVLKYSSAGARLWAATPYDSPGGGRNDYPTTVAFDPAGNVIAVGYVSNAGDEDWWIAEYNGATGAQVRAPTTYGGAAAGQERPRALAVDSAGDAYVAGYVRDGAGKKDLALVKVSGTTGAVLWHREYLGALGEDDEALGVEIDPIDGTVLVAGTTTVAPGDRDLILVRYGAAGDVVQLDEQGNIVASGGTPWQRVFDRPGFDDAFVAMDMDVTGNVCVAGATQPTAGGNKDVVSVKYDYLGNVMGGVVFNGAANGNDEASSVAVNRYGEAFIAGYVTSAGGTPDYLVLKCVRETLEAPSPVAVTPRYTTAVLTWSDNTFSEDGFSIQRKAGAGAWEDVQSPAADATTWTDTGLGASQTYSYRMRSRKGGDASRWTPEKTVTTLTPAAPGNLVVAAQNTTTMRLTWGDNTTGEQEDGFKVQRCEGAGCTFATYAEYTVGANLQTWDDVEVSPDKVYSYRIYAYRTGLWTSAFSAANANNTDKASPTLVNKHPSPFNASRVNEEKIDVTWSARTTDHSNFQLQRCTGDATACTDTLGVWADVAASPLATGTAAWSDTTAPAGGTYRYRIRAHKNAGVASWDTIWAYSVAVVESITAPVLSPPAVVSTTQVALGWTDGTANETNFVVQRCPGSGTACDEDAEFAPLTTLTAGATSHTDATACPGTQYTYRVRATNTTRSWSSAWSAQTAPATPSPVAPANLVTTGLTESTVGVAWDDTTLDRDQVTVYRCDGTGCDPTTVAGTFNARPGMLLRLEETAYTAAAGDVKDASTYLAHGTSAGGLTSLATAKFGRGATFDGVNDRVTVPHHGGVQPGTLLTVEAWAKSGAANWEKTSTLLSKMYQYKLWTTLSTKTVTFTHSVNAGVFDSVSFTPDAAFDLTQWHHYAATYDGATMRLYVDGVEKASKARTGTTYNSTQPLYVGWDQEANSYWKGSLDDVAVHLRALPAVELADHAARGAQRGYAVVSGLGVGATYTFKLVAAKTVAGGCNGGWSVTSATAEGTTIAPPAPTNLTATVASTTQLNLGWTDNTTSETGFQAQRCPGTGAACDEDGEFVWTKTLAVVNTVAYNDTEACSGTQYTYRVRGQKTTVPTWDTAWALGTGTTPAPQPATDVAAAALTESTVKVTVRDRNSDETGYRIERCTGTAATCTTDGQFSLVHAGAAGTFTEEAEGASLWLKMEEASWASGTANQVADASGSTNHGTPYNGATTTTGGVSGRAATFDGTDDYVQLQYKAGVPTNNFTLEAWVKPTATHEVEAESTAATGGIAGQRYLFGPDYRDAPAPASGAGVSVGTNGVSVYEHSGGYLPPLAVYNAGANGIPSTSWTHVVVTYTNGQPRIYVNGALVRVGLTSPKTTVYAPTTLGGRYSTTCYYAGQVDNAVVLPRALTDAEVAARFAGQLLSRIDATASPGTAYTYRITPYKTATCPWAYQWVTSEVATPAPPKPTGLAATAVNSNRIDLAWNDLSGAENQFRVERCTGDAAACAYDPQVDVDAKFSLVANVAGTAGTSSKSYAHNSLTAVCAGTTYTYRVRAEKTSAPTWTTAWSDGATRQAPAPAGPSPFAANRYSEAQVNLTWTNASTNAETGLQVQRCTLADCSDAVNAGSVLAAGTTSYSDSRLPADRNFWYRVQVQKTGACGWETATFSAIDAADTELREPTALAATAANTTTVNLIWTRNTATDTDTLVRRCTGTLAECCPSGTCSGTFDDVGWASAAATSFADATAAHGTAYTYRVRSKSQGLASGGAQTWAYRAPISGLTANTVVEVPVTWRGAMQPDFDDLRFYDETAQAELPYWIKAKADGASATAWVKVGANTNVSLYYGNASAAGAGSELGVLEFHETFPGAAIDAARWVEIDPDGTLSQNNGLIVTDVNDNWTRALISQQTFARTAGKEVYVRLTTGADVAGTEHLMMGWELNQTASPSYGQLVYGFYWNNYLLNTYEKGGQTGPNTQPYAPNTDYEIRVVLKATGATYYVKGGAYAAWTLVRDSASYADTPLRIAVTQYSHAMRIHEIRVSGAKAGGVAVGAEGAASAGGAFEAAVLWTSGDSNAADALTSTPTAPAVTGVTSTTDRRVDVTWTDTNPDESSFVLERCDLGDSCADQATFSADALIKATVGAGAGTAADTTADPSKKYYYRVRAHKDATNAWDTLSSPVSIVTVTQKVADLSAAADGSRRIDLAWTDFEPLDAAYDESGYEVEVMAWNGVFTKIATLPADATAYTDAVAIDPGKTYTYRVRSFRTGSPTVYSPYSNEASATPPAYVAGDTTCASE